MAVNRFSKSILKRERPVYHTLGSGEAPNAPIIGITTVIGSGNSQTARITFTPVTTGVPATQYYAVSYPNGDFVGTGTTSPISVAGGNFGPTKYSFVVYAQNNYGSGLSYATSGPSAPSNFVTLWNNMAV
jgi:hypothetical protein